MSFDLRLRYVGLALYVPEGRQTMHVLLPATSGHQHGSHEHPDAPGEGGGVTGHEHSEPSNGGGTATLEAPQDANEPGTAAAPVKATDPHFARIVYDAAYERPEEGQLSRTYRMVDFTGRVLELKRALAQVETTEELDPNLTNELPPLKNVAHPVSQSMVSGVPSGAVAGRVTVDTGALTRYELGATFHLESDVESQRMTTETEWTIRGITSLVPASDELDAPLVPGFPRTLLGPEGAPEKALPRLYPIGQIIELMVFNAVASEFPPKGAFSIKNDDGDAEHFEAYYEICEKLAGVENTTPRATIDIPEVAVEGDDLPVEKGPHRPGFTCVQAQAALA